MQKILIMHTENISIRSECFGWGGDNGDCVLDAYFQYQRGERVGVKKYNQPNDVPVGLMGGMKYSHPNYPTVLHAIGQGWKLMAPPVSYKEKRQTREADESHNLFPTYEEIECFEWWLTKD